MTLEEERKPPLNISAAATGQKMAVVGERMAWHLVHSGLVRTRTPPSCSVQHSTSAHLQAIKTLQPRSGTQPTCSPTSAFWHRWGKFSAPGGDRVHNEWLLRWGVCRVARSPPAAWANSAQLSKGRLSTVEVYSLSKQRRYTFYRNIEPPHASCRSGPGSMGPKAGLACYSWVPWQPSSSLLRGGFSVR